MVKKRQPLHRAIALGLALAAALSLGTDGALAQAAQAGQNPAGGSQAGPGQAGQGQAQPGAEPLPAAPMPVPQPSSSEPATVGPAAGAPAAAPPTEEEPGGQAPVGTAAAPYEKGVGTAASRPAGAVIAPDKQHRRRTLLISLGLVAAAAIAIGAVAGLSSGSPSTPSH